MTALLERPVNSTGELLPRYRLDTGICLLRSDLIRMMDTSRIMLRDAMNALYNGDVSQANAVIERDNEVDELERCIEKRAILLVATQQPVAYELRFVSTALKVTTDIERIGDHAVNIARTVLRLVQCQTQTALLPEIKQMGVVADELLQCTAEAFSEDDAIMAQVVIERDDEMDVLYRESQTELRFRMRETPAQSVAASHLLFVGHYLERVGDHCANAAERLDFLVTGRVLHS